MSTLGVASSAKLTATSTLASHIIQTLVRKPQLRPILCSHFTDPELRVIGNWLSPLNFKLVQDEIFYDRQDGTGQWLLESEEFQGWRDGRAETLWCHGLREISSPMDTSPFAH